MDLLSIIYYLIFFFGFISAAGNYGIVFSFSFCFRLRGKNSLCVA